MKYLLGIDEGSQSCKMTIYDTAGNIVCRVSEPLAPMTLAAEGVAEHPGDDLWDKLCKTAKRLMREFDGDPGDITAAGLCTIRFCRALMNDNGTLAQPVMSWMDARVSRPHEWTNPDVKYVTTSSGYITRRLTGELQDSAANYLGVWPLDMDTWDYCSDDKALEEYNLRRENLLSLRMPGEILGYITAEAARETGLPEGLPIAATANDKAVEALGAGCIHTGYPDTRRPDTRRPDTRRPDTRRPDSGCLDSATAVISLGTYIAAMTPGARNLRDPKNLWVNMACAPNQYLYESGGVRRGMWMLSWWTKFLGEEFLADSVRLGVLPETRLEREAETIPPGSDGLLIVPHWLALTSHPYRKGMILGFDARHGRGHVYRAMMESIAMTIRNSVDAMCAETGSYPEEFVITGGGSNSGLFLSIFADVLNKPVSRASDSGSAGLGSAICAAVASGVYGSFSAAVEGMVRKGETYYPDDSRAAVYDRINTEVFRSLTDFGDEVFKKTFPIFG